MDTIKADIEIQKGDDFYETIAVADDDGVPVDITGWEFYLTVKEHLDDEDEDALIQVDITSHDDAENGKTVMRVPNSEMGMLETGVYYYDIQMKTDTGIVKTLCAGLLKICQDITRRAS